MPGDDPAQLSQERAGPESATSANRGNAIVPPDTDGLEQAIANAATDWWFQGAMVAIRQLAIGGRGFTVQHLRDMVGEPSDYHYWGAVLSAAQRQGVIQPVGAVVSSDGKLLRIWWGLPT